MTTMGRFFVWLSGTSHDTLVLCGPYERMKYAALGSTLLVPAVTGMLAGYYTIHSLTQGPVLSAGIAAFWALALVVIDRAILVTYHKGRRQLPSVFIRMAIAGLAGILIAHMLVLFVFRDQIDQKLDQRRQQSIAGLTQAAQQQIGLARSMEEARGSSAIHAKQREIDDLKADKERLYLYSNGRPRERLLIDINAKLTLAYSELDQLHQQQSYEATRQVEARLAADVDKERSRRYDDVLSRTAALHDVIWERAGTGVWSGLIAYILLVLLLFTLDTLPIAVKVLLPVDTYERVLARTLMDIENRIMLEAQERWEAVQLETTHRIESRKLLAAPAPVAQNGETTVAAG